MKSFDYASFRLPVNSKYIADINATNIRYLTHSANVKYLDSSLSLEKTESNISAVYMRENVFLSPGDAHMAPAQSFPYQKVFACAELERVNE